MTWAPHTSRWIYFRMRIRQFSPRQRECIRVALTPSSSCFLLLLFLKAGDRLFSGTDCQLSICLSAGRNRKSGMVWKVISSIPGGDQMPVLVAGRIDQNVGCDGPRPRPREDLPGPPGDGSRRPHHCQQHQYNDRPSSLGLRCGFGRI
jgi:hypothetical protein